MNVVDREFALLAREIRGKSEEELFEGMKAAFLALPPASARSLERFFNAYGYWGRLDAETGDFEELPHTHRRACKLAALRHRSPNPHP